VENDTSDAAVDASTAVQQITQLPQPKPTSDDTPGPKPPFGSRGFAAAQHLESSHPRHVPLGVSFWRRHFGKVDASPSAFELP
jgi:hypothetical protein